MHLTRFPPPPLTLSRSSPPLCFVQVPQDVLAQDDPHIDHRANRDRNARQSNDVGIDAKGLHRDEAHQHRQGQQSTDQDRTAKMQHHHQNDDDRNEDFFRQCSVERSQSFIDDAGSIIERNDADLAGCDPTGPLIAWRIAEMPHPGIVIRVGHRHRRQTVCARIAVNLLRWSFASNQ